MKVIRTQDALGRRTDGFQTLGMLFITFLKTFIFRKILTRKFSRMFCLKQTGFWGIISISSDSRYSKDFLCFRCISGAETGTETGDFTKTLKPGMKPETETGLSE